VLELCDTLGVSKATLDGALRELEGHNMVYRRHGVGIFVSPLMRRTIVVICPPDFALRPGIRDFGTYWSNRHKNVPPLNENFSVFIFDPHAK
jgi:hypothetical protein